MTKSWLKSPQSRLILADFSDLPTQQRSATKRPRPDSSVAPEQLAKIVRRKPKPLILKRPRISSLEESVGQIESPPPKKFCPQSVHSSVVYWLEENFRSYRDRPCRSDSHLSHLGCSKSPPKRLAKSEPIMAAQKNTDNNVLPVTPPIVGIGSLPSSPGAPDFNISSTLSRSVMKSPAEDDQYRARNLYLNNIFLRDRTSNLPPETTSLISLAENAPLELGAAESKVQSFFQTELFPRPTGTLNRSERLPMARSAIPYAGSEVRVSNPIPDILYGYHLTEAFSQHRVQIALIGSEFYANSDLLLFPFFVIEIRGDGPGKHGGLWAATNQCIGGSATSVNIVERLNHRLRRCNNPQVQTVDNCVFGIAMNGTEARLFVTWYNGEYSTQKIRTFSLQEPEQYLEFRKFVLNIIEWGTGGRLAAIKRALDNLQKVDSKFPGKLSMPLTNPPIGPVTCSFATLALYAAEARLRKA